MPRDPAAPTVPRPSVRALLACGAVAILLPASARAEPFAASDLLHVIGADGRARLVQHVLTADGVELTLRLPELETPARVTFAGPDRERWQVRHARRPERVSIGSGTAVVRYRHRGDAAEAAADDMWLLVARSVPEALEIGTDADGRVPDFRAVSAWTFPDGARVSAWRVQDAPEAGTAGAGAEGGTGADPGSPGRWDFADDVLTWSQDGLAAVTLEIEYRMPGPAPARVADREVEGADDEPVAEDSVPATAEDRVAGSDAPPAAASIDTDADGVPDVRDVCLRGTADPAPSGALGTAAADAAPGAPGDVDELGCLAGAPLVLGSVGFPTGRTRLDLPARRTLDRLAAALGTSDDDWEIAAHTDGVGPRSRNLSLSLRRAESVRHYLMLRGVAPNRLVARGYGEAEPVADDATAAGRAANRRVELRRIDPDAAPVTDGVGEDPPDGDG